MSKKDKNEGLDDTVEGLGTDKDAATPDPTIEDAEIVGETSPEGEELEQAATDTTDAAAAEEIVGDTEIAPVEDESTTDVTDAEEVTEGAAETNGTADPADETPAEAAPETESTMIAPVIPVAGASETAGGAAGGVLPTVFGGVLAAFIGFGAAQFIHVDWLSMTGFGTDPVAGALDRQAQEIAALRERLDDVESTTGSAVEATMTGIATEITGRYDTMAGGLSGLTDQVGALEGKVADQLTTVDGTVAQALTQMESVNGEITRVGDALGSVDTRLTGVGDRLNGLDERMAEVDARLVEVEKRPLVESSDTARAAFGIYEQQLDDLRKTLEDQQAQASSMEESMTTMAATARAEMTAVREEAEDQLAAVRNQTEEQLEQARAEAQAQVEAAEARAAEAEAASARRAELAVAQASLSQVEAALNAGISYEVALPALQAIVDVPTVIVDNGASGIPTLLQLQESYTPAARDALDASIKATMSNDPGNRVLAFLQTQTGVRSLKAREGDDPDAVLSRMTVAVENGDLATALSEYEALPDEGKGPLSTWADDASDRLAAEAALPDLAASLNTN